MKLRLVTTICTIASAMMAAAQVPSLINYQGRLTDASGAPVTGSKNFSISIYDAATAGNLLYTETIGAVSLDANGVYSFQFGGTGTSNSQVTETLATTDAATLFYTKALANTGIVENSITVTDGTNTWNQSVGNPGSGATATANTISGFVIGATITNGGSGYTSPPAVTIIGNGTGAAATAVLTEGVVTGITITSAGSGYTGTPTISIAPPVIPFRVDYSSGTITATYSGAPSSGRAITASYRYGTNGITGALSSGAEHWIAISVDGTPQATRQRMLAVPFASKAKFADVALEATDHEARNQIAELFTSISANRYLELSTTLQSSSNFDTGLIQATKFAIFPSTFGGTFETSPLEGSSKLADYFLIGKPAGSQGGWYEIQYANSETVRVNVSPADPTPLIAENPYPQEEVTHLRCSFSTNSGGATTTLAIFTPAETLAVYSISGAPNVKRGAIVIFSSNGSPIRDLQLILKLQDGRSIQATPGSFVDLDSSVTSISIKATSPAFDARISKIKMHY